MEDLYDCYSYGGCEGRLCFPSMKGQGWFGSVWTWLVIILTVGIVWASIVLTDVDSDWYKSLKQPMGMISQWGFSVIWGILYLGILISIVMSSWDTKNPRSGCMVLVYTIIIILTLLWVVAFFQYYMLVWGCIILVIILLMTLWLIWLVTPPRNSSGGWFPHIFFWIFFAWIVIALYYNISFAVMNPTEC